MVELSSEMSAQNTSKSNSYGIIAIYSKYILTSLFSPGDSRQVLNDLSVVFESGQKVGVVGRTGRFVSPMRETAIKSRFGANHRLAKAGKAHFS